MTAPKYEWTCHKCDRSNLAHTAICAACGFSAYFKAAELQNAPPIQTPAPLSSKADGTSTFVMFFPEGIPAIALVIYAPIWALKMFANGAALAPLCLLAVEAACIYGFAQGWKHGSKWFAWACMIIFLLIALAIGVFD